MHCLYGGYNLHRFSDALGLVIGCYSSNKKNIIASLLKFAGYIHNHKILPGNIFGLILKNKMATRDVYLS